MFADQHGEAVTLLDSIRVPQLLALKFRAAFELCRFQSSRCCYREAMLFGRKGRS